MPARFSINFVSCTKIGLRNVEFHRFFILKVLAKDYHSV
jgi:hypothetical protein